MDVFGPRILHDRPISGSRRRIPGGAQFSCLAAAGLLVQTQPEFSQKALIAAHICQQSALLNFYFINLEFELAGFLRVRESNSEQIVSVGVEL